ncbi:MAG: imidazolonepropionase, partial [Candidatus Eremiobacteraeota bacterium]|nr:imidazolonepropionase [Candidatus Eremiobacteraeota bacterium]
MQQTADLIVSARQVVTCAPGNTPRSGLGSRDVGVIENGSVALLKDRIVAVGPTAQVRRHWTGDHLELPESSVIPGLIDAHSHPLFAGSRIGEFIMRAQGASYQEIHAAGGGIASTVKATCEASDDELLRSTSRVMERMLVHGTTTLEAKSGYGLAVEQELRHLRILRQAAEGLPIEVVTTCLGAHALPPDYADRRQDFIRTITDELLPAVREQGLAEYSDVFCEVGAFTLEESRQVLEASRELGFGLRIHAEEFNYLGGARMAAELGAATADHLQCLRREDFEAFRQGGTIAVMIPGTSFFLDMDLYAPARPLLEADLPVALGTDFNDCSCLTASMPTAVNPPVI